MILFLLAAALTTQIRCQVIVDPHTGQTKTKNRLGGAYPGRRQPAGDAHVSGDGTAHFQVVPGGNALQLVSGERPEVVAEPGSSVQYIQGTLVLYSASWTTSALLCFSLTTIAVLQLHCPME